MTTLLKILLIIFGILLALVAVVFVQIGGLFHGLSVFVLFLLGTLQFPVGIWVAVAIHELGHYVFGKWRGFSIVQFIVFGKSLFSAPTYKDYRLRPYLGYVMVRKENPSRADLAWGVAAGPGFSILFGALGLMARSPFPRESVFTILEIGLHVFGFFSLSLGVINLLFVFDQRSDGGQLYGLIRHPDRIIASYKLHSMLIELWPYRPKDYSDEHLDSIRNRTGLEYLYYSRLAMRCFDSNDVETAKEYTQAAYRLALACPQFSPGRADCFYLMANVAARHYKDKQLANEAFELGWTECPNPIAKKDHEIVKALIWGDTVQAKVDAKAFGDLIVKSSPNESLGEYSKDYIQRMFLDYEQHITK